MTIYFRYHRGTLKESLETQVEVKSLKKLQMMLNEEIDSCCTTNPPIEAEEMKYYGYDKRCNQYLWLVIEDWYTDYKMLGWTPYPIGFICYDKDKLPDSFWSE